MREDEIAELMRNDPLVSALLPGGIYTNSATSIEGFRRGDDSVTGAAFDANGDLLTCALVKQRALVPLAGVRNPSQKFAATRQMVEIYFYEGRGYEEIELAKVQVYALLEGARLSDSYPMHWDYETPPIPDMGPIQFSTVLRQDWIVTGMRRG